MKGNEVSLWRRLEDKGHDASISGKAVAKPDLAAGPLFRLAYRSQSLIPADRLEAELAQILRGARAKNSEFKATGALMFYADWFAQLLEGAEDVVKLLYERIKRDPRHDSVNRPVSAKELAMRLPAEA